MLKKLSLAALVAMGTMSVASASTDLSEAIKGVTIGGYLRYRGTEKNVKTDGSDNNVNTTKNEYKAVLNMNIKASDTVKVHSRLVYVDAFYTNKSAVDAGNNDSNKAGFNVREAYINYKANGANVKAGLQAPVTPLTDHDDDYANGLLATYTVSGITAAAAYFNQISNASAATTLTNNITVLGVVGNIKPAKVQAWYYNVSDSGDDNKDGKYAYFLEAAADVGPVAAKMQYAAAKKNTDDAKTQKFFALALTGKVDVASVTAAYLNFGKDGSDVTVGTTNADGLIAAGDILEDVIQENSNVSHITLQDGSAIALVASAKVSGVKAGVQYVRATSKTATDNTTYSEYDLDLCYAYNKKLKFSGYYAILQADNDVADDSTTNQLRFEAKYSF